MQLKVILDFKDVYGDIEQKSITELIYDIPSKSLLYHISEFNIKLYLMDVGIDAHKIQSQLLNILVTDNEIKARFEELSQLHLNRGHWPIVIWRYSNLLFYEAIFNNYNNIATRILTPDEMKRVLDAYLILNSITSQRLKITEEEIKEAVLNEESESIILPNFIYQKDFISNTEFTNQVTRGFEFFKYLESSPKFAGYVKLYYENLKVNSCKDLFRNLITIFTQVNLDDFEKRTQVVDLSSFVQFINLDFINSLVINSEIASYKTDLSFTTLRNKILYLPEDKLPIYLLLDINFLIDQFYKTQVFAFKQFIKNQGYNGDFLAVKAKEFMEENYFKLIMSRCFSHFTTFPGSLALKKDKNELADYYIRSENNVALVEFKDILLGADIKENATKEQVYSALDLKFYENQRKKPKGIKQLLNGLEYIENNTLDFDDFKGEITVYPIVIYTDTSFGYEGINKILNSKFRLELDKLNFKKIKVKNVTFISLSFFELHENYLKHNKINIFDMINFYHEHILSPEVSTNPFEVFSRFYIQENIKENLGNPDFTLETLNNIMQ